MPSPIAHTLAGLALGHTVAPRELRGSLAWTACVVFAANAPDLDFAAGLAIGHVNWLHGGPTHSFSAALLFAGLGAALAGLTKAPRGRVFLALAAVYTSHFVLDLFCGFPGRPTRLAVFWPLTTERFGVPWHPLAGVLHGSRDAGFSTFVGEVFLPHNLRAFAIEAAVFLPAVWWSRRAGPRPPAQDKAGP